MSNNVYNHQNIKKISHAYTYQYILFYSKKVLFGIFTLMINLDKRITIWRTMLPMERVAIPSGVATLLENLSDDANA